jgi:uncharacterized protein YutE (UPF0331/DUF86 family)
MILRREAVEERLKELDEVLGERGFRNILIHRYLGIDPREVFENFNTGLTVFPRFAGEVLVWLDGLTV